MYCYVSSRFRVWSSLQAAHNLLVPGVRVTSIASLVRFAKEASVSPTDRRDIARLSCAMTMIRAPLNNAWTPTATAATSA